MTTNEAENPRYRIFEELDGLGFKAGVTLKGPWEDPADVYAYIRQELVPPGCRIVVPKQVHGSHIKILSGDGILPQFDADGVITIREKTCLTVTTADCLPLVAADPISGYFAVIHVGWRSFVAGIIDNFNKIGCELGMDLNQARIILGPSIGPCCFEVGSEVAALFDSDNIQNRNGSVFVDLRKAVGNKLISLGVVKENIRGIVECTSCNPEKYYSYRRDKESPVQMVAFIYRSIN